MSFRSYFLLVAHLLIVGINLQATPEVATRSYTTCIEDYPLILSNHDLTQNSLQKSVYELLENAQSSILIFSFTFTDSKVINLINQKAQEGVHVQLVIDRDHLGDCKGQLHSSIHLDTRTLGEGHLHHKILVVDGKYIWLSSGNFTPGGFTVSKNLAITFVSEKIAGMLQQEAADIIMQSPRNGVSPLTSLYGNQLLELYVLPHNAPEAPRATETKMNELGKQKLLSLIDNARHHIKISVDVWTYKDASRAIINAFQRGVQVDIVVGDSTSEAVKMMSLAGCKIQQGKNVHNKFMLVDHTILLSGSANWTMNAFSRSDESFIVLYDLTQEQLQALEGILSAAGLPLEMHFNVTAQSINEAPLLSDEEINKNVELINKTIALLHDEINKTATSQEHQRLIAIAKRLKADLATFLLRMKGAAPGCCFYNGDNFLSNVVTIAEKQERINAALKYIHKDGRVDQKITDYFQRTLQKLQSGMNVPLPDYFHATKAGLESIVASKTILQSTTGLTGPATYISCNNEGNYGYGNYAFAIDEGCLVDTKGIFRTGRHPVTNVFFSLWASILKDIPVSEENIAFIDAAEGDIAYVKELLKKQNLNIEVVSRDTAEGILKIFDVTTPRRELPSFFWNKFEAQDYLPTNMYPRSVQGTFREFMF